MKRIVVIGGGIAGLTTALQLRDRQQEISGGVEVVLLEDAIRAVDVKPGDGERARQEMLRGGASPSSLNSIA